MKNLPYWSQNVGWLISELRLVYGKATLNIWILISSEFCLLILTPWVKPSSSPEATSVLSGSILASSWVAACCIRQPSSEAPCRVHHSWQIQKVMGAWLAVASYYPCPEIAVAGYSHFSQLRPLAIEILSLRPWVTWLHNLFRESATPS